MNVHGCVSSKTLVDHIDQGQFHLPGWVQTDLGGPENRAAAPTAADDAAQIVVDMALSPTTGRFVDAEGTVAW